MTHPTLQVLLCHEVEFTMEPEEIVFTPEDVSVIHRNWIQQLYLHDRKSEAEIVTVLSQQNLTITYVTQQVSVLKSPMY